MAGLARAACGVGWKVAGSSSGCNAAAAVRRLGLGTPARTSSFSGLTALARFASNGGRVGGAGGDGHGAGSDATSSAPSAAVPSTTKPLHGSSTRRYGNGFRKGRRSGLGRGGPSASLVTSSSGSVPPPPATGVSEAELEQLKRIPDDVLRRTAELEGLILECVHTLPCVSVTDPSEWLRRARIPPSTRPANSVG